MVFYIHDQGARVSTPLDLLLKPAGVASTDKIVALKPTGSRPDAAVAQHRTVTRKSALTQYTEEHTPQPRGQLIYAQQIMTAPVQTCFAEQTFNDCRRLLAQGGFHHIPVLNQQQRLCGIVSDRDFLRFAANNSGYRAIGKTPVAQLMTQKVISAAASTEIRTLAEVMCRQSIGAVPIVDEHSNVTGIVTRSDILRTLINRAPVELWA